ncbi:MAG TPA: acyltransferase [Phycisphaerae bacterium]|nr:acyltransferase [Phycisphaerae bacterium]
MAADAVLQVPLDHSAAPALSKPPPPRLDFLDGLRALAAIHVIFLHAGMTVWDTGSNRLAPWFFDALLHWFGNAHYAVVAFITLSGFCLTLPLVRDDGLRPLRSLDFFKKRCKRILPPYWLALVLSALLGLTLLSQKTQTVWDISIPVTAKAFLTHVALIHNVTRNDSTINYPLWTIAVEWQIYLCFPLIVLALRRFSPITILTIAIIACYSAAFLLRHTPFSGLTCQFLVLFLLGSVACLVVRSTFPYAIMVRRHAPTLLAAVIIAALALFTLNGLMSSYDVWRYQWLLDLPAGIIFAAFLVCLPRFPALRRPFESKLLVAIGGFSYSVYLIHAPLLQFLWQYVAKPLQLSNSASFLFLCLLGIPLILTASFLFFLVAERPFMNRRPSLPITPKLPAIA